MNRREFLATATAAAVAPAVGVSALPAPGSTIYLTEPLVLHPGDVLRHVKLVAVEPMQSMIELRGDHSGDSPVQYCHLDGRGLVGAAYSIECNVGQTVPLSGERG